MNAQYTRYTDANYNLDEAKDVVTETGKSGTFLAGTCFGHPVLFDVAADTDSAYDMETGETIYEKNVALFEGSIYMERAGGTTPPVADSGDASEDFEVLENLDETRVALGLTWDELFQDYEDEDVDHITLEESSPWGGSTYTRYYFENRDGAFRALGERLLREYIANNAETSSVEEWKSLFEQAVAENEAITDDEIKGVLGTVLTDHLSREDYAAWYFGRTDGYMTDNVGNAVLALEALGYNRLGNPCLWDDYATIC